MSPPANRQATELRPAGQPVPPAGGPAAPETIRLYAADWRRFARWCRLAGVPALPADPASIVAYVQSEPGRRPGTLRRWLAGIDAQHRQRGLPVPARDPALRPLLRAARVATKPRRPAPSPAQLTRMALACPGDLAGLRDRALLLLAAHGLGRAALVGPEVRDLGFSAGGAELHLAARSGMAAQLLQLPRADNPRICPMQALRAWLDASDTRFGPVFRKIDRWGNVEHSALGTDAIRRILERRGKRTKRARTPAGQAA